jgi:hypothetical protein
MWYLPRRLVTIFGNLANYVRHCRNRYQPQLHYMRGPGPAWHAKHAQSQK